MSVLRSVSVLTFVLLALPLIAHAGATEPMQQSVQLKAGAYFSASKSFDPGNGVDLLYSIRPIPYVALDASMGYYRAEKVVGDTTTSYLSAIPLTVAARAILPLPYISMYAGGGAGVYYKMAQIVPHTPAPGLTELSADLSEFSLGYHATAGIEYPASSGLSLLLEGKYVFVDQGKFKEYEINHGGAFLYGGFVMVF